MHRPLFHSEIGAPGASKPQVLKHFLPIKMRGAQGLTSSEAQGYKGMTVLLFQIHQ